MQLVNFIIQSRNKNLTWTVVLSSPFFLSCLWFQMRTSASEYIWPYIPAYLVWLFSPKLKLSNKLSFSHAYSKLDLLHDTGSCQFNNTKHFSKQTEGSSSDSKCNTNSKRYSTLEESEISPTATVRYPNRNPSYTTITYK